MTRYTIKKYLDINAQQKANIWDEVGKCWVFDYMHPKHYIKEARLLGSHGVVFSITDTEGSEAYMYDIEQKKVFELGTKNVEIDKLDMTSQGHDFSIFRAKNGLYYASFDDGDFFEIPGYRIKNEVPKSCNVRKSVTRELVALKYETKVNDPGNNYYDHIRLFDKATGNELFDKYTIRFLVEDSDKVVCGFCDNTNTYMLNDSLEIVKTFVGYLKLNKLFLSETEDCFCLSFHTEKHPKFNEYPENDTNIIVDRHGNELFRIQGRYVRDLWDFSWSTYQYCDTTENRKKLDAARDRIKGYFVYRDRKKQFICIDCRHAQKFEPCDDVFLFLTPETFEHYYIIQRNGLIFIYNEDMECMSKDWVIYEAYKTNDGEIHHEHRSDMVFEYNTDTHRFYFRNAHVKKNDGSPNTMDDWTFMSGFVSEKTPVF